MDSFSQENATQAKEIYGSLFSKNSALLPTSFATTQPNWLKYLCMS